MTNEYLSKTFARYQTAYCLSKAMLEDYVKVVAKLEGVGEEEVKARVMKRTEELFAGIREESAEEMKKFTSK